MLFNKTTIITKKQSLQLKSEKFCKVPSNLYGFFDLTPALRRVLLLVFITSTDEKTDLSRVLFRFNGGKSSKRLKESLKELCHLGYIEINEKSFDGWEIFVNYSKFKGSLFKNIPRFIATDLRLSPAQLDIICFHQIFGYKAYKNLAYCTKVMNIDPKTYAKHLQVILKYGFRFAGCEKSDKAIENDSKLKKTKIYHDCVLKHKFYAWTNSDRDQILNYGRRVIHKKSVNNNGHFSAHNIIILTDNKKNILDIRKLRLLFKKPNLDFPKNSMKEEFLQRELRSMGSFLDLRPRQKAYLLKSIQNSLKAKDFAELSLSFIEDFMTKFALDLDEKHVYRTFQSSKQFVNYMTKVIISIARGNGNSFGYDDALKPENSWFVTQIHEELKEVKGSEYSLNYVIWKIKMLKKGKSDFRMYNPKLLKEHIKKFLIKDLRNPSDTEDWSIDYNFVKWEDVKPSPVAVRIIDEARVSKKMNLFGA